MKTQTKLFRVESALKEVEMAEEFAQRIIHEAYPEGSYVNWWRGGVQYGTITHNSKHRCGDRFRVRNEITGKEYWITFYDIKRGNNT